MVYPHPINMSSIVSINPVIGSVILTTEYLSVKKAQFEKKTGISYTPLKSEIEAVQILLMSIELFASGILLLNLGESKKDHKEGKSCIKLSMQGLGVGLFHLCAPALTAYSVYRCYTWYQG